MAKSAFLKSSIAKKYWMSLTGLFLCLFLVGHLLGNLQLFMKGYEGALQFNKYALFMTTNPAVKILSYVTYISILFHAIDGIALTIQNRKARPIKYAYKDDSKSSSFSSRNMAVLGTLVLIFISTHMVNFWAKMHFSRMPLALKVEEQMGVKQFSVIGTPDSQMPFLQVQDEKTFTDAKIEKQFFDGIKAQTNGQYDLKRDGTKIFKIKTGEVVFEGYKDLYKVTKEFFKSDAKLFGIIPQEGLFFVIFYVLSMIALAFHLWHGFQSAFQSLGATGKFTPAIKLFGKVFSIIVPLAFAAIPIYIRFFLK